jgi:hypothetical protein
MGGPVVEALVIESCDARSSLALRASDRAYFLADLRGAGLAATALVSRHMSLGLAGFFAGIAADWTGWDGVREWRSFEGELTLHAESQRTGHVHLRVDLRCGTPPDWKAQAGLLLESGQLDRLASAAQEFEDWVIRAT